MRFSWFLMSKRILFKSRGVTTRLSGCCDIAGGMMAGDVNLGLHATGHECSKEFLGSWSLVSFERVLSNGEVLKPFGDAALGSLLYQADGHMSAQLSGLNRPKLSSGEPLDASVEETSDAWRSYMGYWGSYRVFAERRVVVHRAEGSSFLN